MTSNNIPILVLEPDNTLRELFVQVLLEEGYAPTGVRSSDEALCLTQNNKFDLIIADIYLNNLSRGSLSQLGQEAPILGVTTNFYPSGKLSSGVVAVLSKPFDLPELIHLVKEIATGRYPKPLN